MNFLVRMLSSDEGIPSSNRVGMLSVILCLLIWQSVALYQGKSVTDIPATWLELVCALGGFVLIGKGVSAYRVVKGPETSPEPPKIQEVPEPCPPSK